MTTISENWDRCLKAGDKVEEEFIEVLKHFDPKTHKKELGNYKFSDIIMPESGKLFEVKRDYKSEETGNWCFEIRFRGKRSGISITKADYMVMVDKVDFWIFRTIDLKNYLKNNWGYFRKAVGGDDKLSEMVLVKKTDLDNFGSYCKINRKNPDLDILNWFINE